MPAPLHFLASPKPLAQLIVTKLVEQYGQADLSGAACVVAVGGDGTTLKALEAVLNTPRVPVFSMRTPGSVGALGNELMLEGLAERLARCRQIAIRPLQFEARRGDGSIVAGVTVNEVAVLRRKFQATRIQIQIDSEAHELFGDGVVVASPIGSTGYCRSLGGPRLPLDADMIAVAGAAIRRPAEGFRMAASNTCTIRIEVRDPVYRPVRIETYSAIVQDACEVTVRSCGDLSVTLLLEPADSIQLQSAPAFALAGVLAGAQDAD